MDKEDWSQLEEDYRSYLPDVRPPLYDLLAPSKTLCVRSFYVLTIEYVIQAYFTPDDGVDFLGIPPEYLQCENPFDRFSPAPFQQVAEVDFTRRTIPEFWDMIEWIRDHTKGRWSLDIRQEKILDRNTRIAMLFSFENLQDAVLFKLTC